jgi:hypothetical protein
MSSYRQLFVTGTARGGTNLVARMLDAHPAATVAVDPFFPLFRSLRDAFLRARGFTVAPGFPLQDYYCSDDRIAALDAVQDGSLGVGVGRADVARLRADLTARACDDAADVVPFLDLVAGETYRELFDGAVAAVAAARSARDGWVGCKEVWVVELFRSIARACPDARFVLVHRDPRAVLASLLALAAVDPTQRAHPLSYARHWRKAVAFGEHYGRDPLFAGRLCTVRYEDVVADPAAAALELSAFLDLEYDDAMLGRDGFVDRARGGVWRGNSSYTDAQPGVADDRVDRWRTSLDPRALALVELVCGPELALAGYEPGADDPDEDVVLAYLEEVDRNAGSWRSDLGDPRRDLECERARRRLLSDDGADTAAARRAFLFEEVFAAARSAPNAVVAP